MSGVAAVFGLCALSFAAGCVLTAIMLRREQPPEPAAEPAPAPPAPRPEPLFPPQDYATKPIHRNPVMGIPTSLPAPRSARPNLALVPDPQPGTELPVRQDAVRRMHVVRTGPTPEPLGSPAEGAETAEPATEDAEPAGAVVEPAEPAVVTEPAEPVGPAEAVAEAAGGVEPVAPAESAGPAEPADEPGEPMVIQVPVRSEPVRRTVEAARRESNR
ncbi:hypothetical protein B0I31_101569 [Saccharothrix carnea]|uniref:Uncharacterized protein n=1 Tax=Saccharothrix carnea TaxID=1280637 RepID=A0A2P8IIS9_SACCR|nr:hypothetical protein [Saccharothrix carnea]PSL58351.1 hypothetical protein B0I31_101569 [Saccharothrix carnea]